MKVKPATIKTLLSTKKTKCTFSITALISTTLVSNTLDKE